MPTPTWDDVVATLTAPGAPFEIGEVRIGDRTVRSFVHLPASLRAVVEGLDGFGDDVHLVYGDERLTFADVAARVRTMAALLVDEVGVEPGDRVAIAARNLPAWPVAFWATVAVGAIAVPLNAWWTGDELRYGLAHSGARVLIADDERLARLERLDGVGALVVLPMRSLDDITGDDPGRLPDVDVALDDDATLFYTSGTTGRPKGAVGSHRNMLTNLLSTRWRLAAMALADGVEPSPPAGQRAVLLSVPLFHVTGAHSVMLPSAAGGMKIVMQHRWDPNEALRLIERERITAFTGVPTMAWELLRSDEATRRDLSSLTYVGSGGAPAPPELVRLVDERVGCPAGNGYGMTETSALAVVNAGAAYRADPGAIGRPVPCNDVRVVGEDGADVPDGEPGELWVRGPCVVRGYWDDQEATAAAFADGWLRTGDLAVRRSDGTLRIVDRLKDVVIRGGENVATVEVEAALYEHPGVLQAAVFGVPDDRLGERVAAVVVPRPGEAPSTGELRRHVADRLAAFKVPEVIVVRHEPLPTNAAGKFLKRELTALVSG